MGYTTLYLSLIVIIPLAGLFWKSATMTWPAFREAITDPELIASLKLTFGLSFVAACINAVFGFVVAWTLVRYPFPGRRLVDGLIDLPFALPTAVSGITLATLYARNGGMGHLGDSVERALHLGAGTLGFLNFDYAYSRKGMLIALVFISLPFIVRTLQPALEDLDPEVEEAAASLGASRSQSFVKVIFPAVLPALLTGFSLAFARAIGEYGSVIFISSNIPGKTEITAYRIMKQVENHNYAKATTLGLVMLVISFGTLAAINGVQWWTARRTKAGGA
jgi:sulfate transport system permease protein